MTNIYFTDEEITENDLFFLCYMTERIARRIHQRNNYVVNQISPDEWRHLISVAGALHSENPLQVEDDWISDYQLQSGDFDITAINPAMETKIPSDLQMGKVYARLILDTLQPAEDYVDAMIRVYNSEICFTIDDYDNGAYYEPSYVIARAYLNGGF